MNKTPFEIRLDLLKMAKEMLEVEYFNKKEQVTQDWQVQVTFAQEKGNDIPHHPDIPPYPTASAVIEKAKMLNLFISNM